MKTKIASLIIALFVGTLLFSRCEKDIIIYNNITVVSDTTADADSGSSSTKLDSTAFSSSTSTSTITIIRDSIIIIPVYDTIPVVPDVAPDCDDSGHSNNKPKHKPPHHNNGNDHNNGHKKPSCH